MFGWSVAILLLTLRAHAIGLVGLLAVELAIVRSGAPDQTALVWGASAGLAGGAAIWLFYRSLAVGTMSVVAPVSGVTAAVVPVVVGLATGERPGTLAIVGIGVALTAIALAPNDSDAYFRRADIYNEMGKESEAKADEAKADELDKKSR